MADLAAAYADARRRLVELVQLEEAQLSSPVPACPGWTVRDVLTHVVGIAADTVQGRYFTGAVDAWRDPRRARARDDWTAAQVASRRGRPTAALVAEWAEAAALMEPMLAGTVPLPPASPAWLRSAPLADLAVHLHDVRGALGRPGDRDTQATRLGLRIYAGWLGRRLDQRGLPALRLHAGDRIWVEGTGRPAAALAAEPFELFRSLSGRRTAAQLQAMAWDGGPAPYLDMLCPYPLPASPLPE